MERFPYTNFHELNLDWILDIVKRVENDLPKVEKATVDANSAAALANRNAVAASDAATRANIATRKIDPVTATATTVYGTGASVTVRDTDPGMALDFKIPAGKRGDPGPAGGAGNLIDNGNFTNPINQRGKSSYDGTGSKMYTIDRWFTTSSISGAVVVGNRFVTVASGSTINQVIPSALGGSFPSDTDIGYTAVSRETNGALHIANSSGLTDSKLSFVIGDAGSGITVTLGSGNWEYCALYRGVYTASNVPGYVPRGYQAEFINCQRYFVGAAGQFAPVAIISDGNARMSLALPVPMRITPTATLINGDSIILNVAGVSKTLAVSGVSVESSDNNFVYVNIACASDATTLFAAGSTFLTRFDLSADM